MKNAVFKNRFPYIILVVVTCILLYIMPMPINYLPLTLALGLFTTFVAISFGVALMEYIITLSENLLTYEFFDKNLMLFICAAIGTGTLSTRDMTGVHTTSLTLLMVLVGCIYIILIIKSILFAMNAKDSLTD